MTSPSTPFVRSLALLLSLAGCDPAPPESRTPADTKPAVVVSPVTHRAADPNEAERRAAFEPEGDEEIVGLIGRYIIADAMLGPVHALSSDEVAALKGKSITIEPGALSIPWLTCDAVSWTHSVTEATKWLSDQSVSSGDEPRLKGKLDARVISWSTPCGSVPVTLHQMAATTVAVSHDGVLFIAEMKR